MYNATKWGLEGIFDSLAKEVAPFKIEVTILEPGGARTNFRKAVGDHIGVAVVGYEGTPVGGLAALIKNPAFVAKGDPAKMVKLMIATVDESPAPSRLVLGADSFAVMHAALTDRPAVVEAQRDVAHSTDAAE